MNEEEKTKRRRGRPRKYDGIAWIRVYMHWDMKRRLKECAKQRRTTISGLVQHIIWDWMQNDEKTQVRKGKYDEFKKQAMWCMRNIVWFANDGEEAMISKSMLEKCAAEVGVQPRHDTLARYMMRMKSEEIIDVPAKTVDEMKTWIKLHRLIRIHPRYVTLVRKKKEKIKQEKALTKVAATN